MITITKNFDFAMAHLLEGHCGLCKNIHGHNYKLEVTVARNGDGLIVGDKSSLGMVIDFSDLKKIVKEEIIDKMDHALAYNKNDETSCEIAGFLHQKIRQKLFDFNGRLTAENMAKWIGQTLNTVFENKGLVLFCIKIKLYETDNSYAEWEANK